MNLLVADESLPKFENNNCTVAAESAPTIILQEEKEEEKELKPAEKIAMFRKSRGKNRTSPAASAASGKKKTTDSS